MACADAYVAMYAVDALRQLAAKLLERAELARFTHQGEALRPFAAVLRHSGRCERLCMGLGGCLRGCLGAPPQQHAWQGGCTPPTQCKSDSAIPPTPGVACYSSRVRPRPCAEHIADSPAVRELAVACVAHAVSAHPRGLGSGWRAVLAALALAAGDASPTVMGQALDALQPVVEALYRPGGHTLLRWAGAGRELGLELCSGSRQFP